VTRVLLACGVVLAIAACSSDDDGADGPDSGECPPGSLLNGQFDGYHGWTEFAFDLDGSAIPGSPHTSGPRRVYLNKKPPHGAKAFLPGTIIIKEIGVPPASQDQVLAMVKVGCDYNSDGAESWEWVDLSVDSSGNAGILWDGPEPPPGSTYGMDATTCNVCHSMAKSNDYVQSQPLLLSNF
jgi:hypothetical protein